MINAGGFFYEKKAEKTFYGDAFHLFFDFVAEFFSYSIGVLPAGGYVKCEIGSIELCFDADQRSNRRKNSVQRKFITGCQMRGTPLASVKCRRGFETGAGRYRIRICG